MMTTRYMYGPPRYVKSFFPFLEDNRCVHVYGLLRMEDVLISGPRWKIHARSPQQAIGLKGRSTPQGLNALIRPVTIWGESP